jgi:hypothetical protein
LVAAWREALALAARWVRRRLQVKKNIKIGSPTKPILHFWVLL